MCIRDSLDTCPVGIATQNPELRKRFTGKPEYVENFMRFIAMELREYMAKLGIRTVNELVGRTDLIKLKDNTTPVSYTHLLINSAPSELRSAVLNVLAKSVHLTSLTVTPPCVIFLLASPRLWHNPPSQRRVIRSIPSSNTLLG